MAVTIVSFRWLEILEKEFDKNFVDLDLLIGDLDGEEPDFVYSARQKLAGLSSCFAQLTHKAQTVFQNSAKIEAELVDLRTELINSKTRQEVLEEESRSLVLQLHSLQLDRLPSNQNPEQYKEKIETALKLSPSKNGYSEEITFRNNSEIKKLKKELLQYQSENAVLRNSILALHSEVYGARLAAKYLDKELAGRIQQLQLLGKEMRTDIRDKLWRQLESEILLHRHKTVIRACRNRTSHELIRPDSRLLSFARSEHRFLPNTDFLHPEPHTKSEPAQTGDGIFWDRPEPRFLPPSEDRLRPARREEGADGDKDAATPAGDGPYNDKTAEDGVSTSSSDDLNLDNVNNNSSGKNNDASDVTLISLDSSLEVAKTRDSEEAEKTDEERTGKEVTTDLANESERTGKLHLINNNNNNVDEDFSCVIGEKRTVMVKRQSGQGLGISITGGREHGVPILISELEVGGPAYECRNLYVGDAILRVNDVSLENASHFEAVKILTNLETNDVRLLVQFIAVDTDEENSLGEDLYGYRYRFFDTEVMDSSDALGLHPVHADSAHTPTAPRTPDYCRRSDASLHHHHHRRHHHHHHHHHNNNSSNHYKQQQHHHHHQRSHVLRPQETFKESFEETPSPLSPHSDDTSERDRHPEENEEETRTPVVDFSSNLIDIGDDPKRREPLEIDLFGFRFQTDMNDVPGYDTAGNDLLDDFTVKPGVEDLPLAVKAADGDLIQMEAETPPPAAPPAETTKYKYVDENIFSGLEDNSLLDNIVKSFSEDDFSYVENEKEKNGTSDSGLEIYLSGSDADGAEKRYPGDRRSQHAEAYHLAEWMDNAPEKIELKTLHQIFDRSFSSNLSSPRGSTSFDDDILSTEHSDEKNNLANNFRNKMKDMKNAYNPKKMQKFYPKNMDASEDGGRRSSAARGGDASALVFRSDNLVAKKSKRTGSEACSKRGKSSRKAKDVCGPRKDSSKAPSEGKRKSPKESSEGSGGGRDEATHKKKEATSYKITDRFDENLIEYNVKSYDVEEGSREAEGLGETGEETSVADELEETRKLSRKYGLKIPGKVVKSDAGGTGNRLVVAEVKSPERCIKILESHFKQFKPVLTSGSVIANGTGAASKTAAAAAAATTTTTTTTTGATEKDGKTGGKVLRSSRYDSFGDPDFGTPV